MPPSLALARILIPCPHPHPCHHPLAVDTAPIAPSPTRIACTSRTSTRSATTLSRYSPPRLIPPSLTFPRMRFGINLGRVSAGSLLRLEARGAPFDHVPRHPRRLPPGQNNTLQSYAWHVHIASTLALTIPCSHPAFPPPLTLQWARKLGYQHVHIWVEPPKMGDEYIFFARSDQQRKPMKREKLREWYARACSRHGRGTRACIHPPPSLTLARVRSRSLPSLRYKRMLDKAKEKGIVESYGAMQDHFGSMKTVRVHAPSSPQ